MEFEKKPDATASANRDANVPCNSVKRTAGTYVGYIDTEQQDNSKVLSTACQHLDAHMLSQYLVHELPSGIVLSLSCVTDTSTSSSAHMSFTSPYSISETYSPSENQTWPESVANPNYAVVSAAYVSETSPSLTSSSLSVPSLTVPDSEMFDTSSSSAACLRLRGSQYVSETSSSLLSGSVVSREEANTDEECVPSTCFVPDTQTCVPETLQLASSLSNHSNNACASNGSDDFDLFS